METIVTNQQLNKVNIDTNVRMRHHAPAVQRVADILKACILSNTSLQVHAFNRNGRYGYCYPVDTSSGRRVYITYDHDNEVIFLKDALRNYSIIHTFQNDDSEMDIILAVRRHLI